MKGGHGEKGTSKLIKQFLAIYISVAYSSIPLKIPKTGITPSLTVDITVTWETLRCAPRCQNNKQRQMEAACMICSHGKR